MSSPSCSAKVATSPDLLCATTRFTHMSNVQLFSSRSTSILASPPKSRQVCSLYDESAVTLIAGWSMTYT